MNQVITDGLILMPPQFSDGLAVWSRQDGRPGSDTWATAPNAALVAADSDFGDCLEILKTEATTRLRYMGETPIIPGTYLRVSARIKVLSGNLPSVRIAAWPGQGSNVYVSGLTESAGSTSVAAYGSIVTVTAILGTGQRGGVDLAWGADPTYAHVGLDLTGPNGGQVRIESITVEDVTSIFHRKLMDWVDVRDYGAVGDGTTDDRAAFAAADIAADGREVLVPEGDFYIGSNLTFTNPVRFEGKLVMPAAARLSLNESFDLDGYAEAFGDEVEGLKKGIQQLFNQSEFEAFDLCGRRLTLTEPLDIQAIVGNRNTYANRRVLRNGQFVAASGSAWNDDVNTRAGQWSASAPFEISGVSNAASIPVGSLVTGPQGVGREVYVRAVNAAQSKVFLSSPLVAPPASQTYTFTRFKYMLDFIGWQNLQRFVVSDIEFLCGGQCSAINLSLDGLVFQIQDCFFTGPKDRAITSADEGCQGMQIDRCQFLSNEQATNVPQRKSICFNINSSDCKIRDNRANKFLHFGVISGSGNIITGNHFFQGDSVVEGVRSPGLVIADANAKMTFSNNYVDNCYIEWTNEKDPTPDFTGGLSFHGLTIQGNIFFATNTAPWMRFISIKPFGTDHFINGLSITGNLFKKTNGAQLEQVEGVDNSIANLDLNRTADLQFDSNTYHGIVRRAENPAYIRAVQNTATQTWVVDMSDVTPFGAPVKYALSVMPDGPVRSTSNVAIYTAPWTQGFQGANGTSLHVGWSQPVRGAAYVTARCDN
ncbi:glycosyl hydrolase family 28-related protein [Hasllibacter sp. MH4015]|uniref:glycosyl hydrolase family 28-related protein n=1 Tax=Hasllibacter sp. MH4015 TaxID=2854029 RepID=UPI001CD5162D|nr:glycosyl hydrolase family 28-related protein [Hasllibacter sp. MH4015]